MSSSAKLPSEVADAIDAMTSKQKLLAIVQAARERQKELPRTHRPPAPQVNVEAWLEAVTDVDQLAEASALARAKLKEAAIDELIRRAGISF